jgi:hypothetical protein
VAASLRALELLYNNATPDWFVLLRAADYPTVPAEKVLAELVPTEADALLDYREVPSASDPRHSLAYGLSISRWSASLGHSRFDPPFPEPENPALKHFVLPNSLELAWRRCMASNVWRPISEAGQGLGDIPCTCHSTVGGYRSRLTLIASLATNGSPAIIKSLKILLNPSDKHLELRRHLRARNDVSDECYYQRILGNASGLRV